MAAKSGIAALRSWIRIFAPPGFSNSSVHWQKPPDAGATSSTNGTAPSGRSPPAACFHLRRRRPSVTASLSFLSRDSWLISWPATSGRRLMPRRVPPRSTCDRLGCPSGSWRSGPLAARSRPPPPLCKKNQSVPGNRLKRHICQMVVLGVVLVGSSFFCEASGRSLVSYGWWLLV